MFGNYMTGRSSTPVTTNLIIINCLMLLATGLLSTRGIDLNRWLGLHYYDSDAYSPYQAISYIFMHGGIYHLFSNMLSLFMFGRLLEMVWGSGRFLIYYLVCGVGAAIIQQLAWRYGMHDAMARALSVANPSVDFGQLQSMTYSELLVYCQAYVDQYVTIGASGSVFGILLAFGMLFPNSTIYLLIPPMPLKAKWLVIGYGVFELFAGVAGSGDGIAHFAHLGGMLFGFILIMMWRNNRRVNF